MNGISDDTSLIIENLQLAQLTFRFRIDLSVKVSLLFEDENIYEHSAKFIMR